MSNDKRPIRVGLVGHCRPDSSALRSAVGRALPRVEFATVNDGRELEAVAGRAGLLLVNRALDGEFTDRDGVEMIRRLALTRNGPMPALMLISNYSEAQADAIAAGAAPGFGKKELNTPRAAERLRAAVAGPAPL